MNSSQNPEEGNQPRGFALKTLIQKILCKSDHPTSHCAMSMVLFAVGGFMITYALSLVIDFHKVLITAAIVARAVGNDAIPYALIGGVAFGFGRLIFIRLHKTAVRKSENTFLENAKFDSLTGLHSGSWAEERLRTVDKSELRICAIVNARRFNEINACFGYEVGDAVLIEIGQRMKSAMPAACFMARINSDVFVFLSHTLGSKQDGYSLVESLMTLLQQPYQLPLGIAMDFSIGTTFSGDESLTEREIIKRMDVALHAVDDIREGGISHFDDAMAEVLQRSRLVELHLRRAIHQELVEPFLQPIINITSGEIEGFEILARWTDATLGTVTPNEFIPVAEKAGLVGRLGNQILAVACRTAVLWPGKLKLSFNVPPGELNLSGMASRLLAILDSTGFPAKSLQIEITESAELVRSTCEKENLRILRSAGVSVVLDDFGTGYCSFERLVSSEIDGLKIDRSFVQAMEDRDDMAAIVVTSVEIAKQLGLRVTAEGVETSDQLHALRRIGCDEAQGYLLGRPMPLVQAHRLVMDTPEAQARFLKGTNAATTVPAPLFA